MRTKRDNVNITDKYFDTAKYKFYQIGIHNTTKYIQAWENEDINLCLRHAGLLVMLLSTLFMINNKIIQSHTIQGRIDYGETIFEVCAIYTDSYNIELDDVDYKFLQDTCHCVERKELVIVLSIPPL